MAMAPADATLRSIFARAMPPYERLAFGTPVPGAGSERLVAAWKASIARDPAIVGRAMELLDLDEDTLARMMSPVELASDSLLPAWAVIIERAIGDASNDQPDTADGILSPFMGLARSELRSVCDALDIEVAETAQRELLDTLRVRLWRAVSPTLEHEKRLLNATGFLFAAEGDIPQLDGSVQGWQVRLGTYPVLAFLIGTVVNHWLSFVEEMLTRIDADIDLLSRELWSGEPVGEITGVSGDAGDLHNGGRSVAILSFGGGYKVVYKPKDLSVAVAYMDLVERLNGLGLPLDLPTRRVVTRGEYSWEAYIDPRGCEDAAAIERFYFRMGETIRLFQLLEARDFWLDNLIAQGEYPQFVDLEMLVQPRVAAPTNLSAAEREAWAALEETAHRTAAVGMPMPIAQGAPAEELGALAGPGPFASPFLFATTALAEGHEGPRLSPSGHVLWDHPEHVPHVGGDYADSAEYLDAVIRGYRAMQSCLVANRETVMDAVRAFRDTPVRYIYRDTWSCLKLIEHSAQPGLLTDAAYREIFFARLYGPVVENAVEGGRMSPVVQSEIEALRGLDVPFFRSVPGSTGLISEDGALAGYFPETAFDRLVNRVTSLGSFPLDAEIDALRSSFACGRPFAAVHVTKGAEPHVTDRDDLLAMATVLAEDILEESFGDGESWLGVIYHPPVDCGAFDVLRPDIMTGTTGLAVLFADLYRCTGDQRWRDAAQRALRSTIDAWDAWLAHPDVGLHHGGTASGALYGSGSWLYGTSRIASALGDSALQERINQSASTLLERLQTADLSGDVADGSIGFLLAALASAPDEVDAAAVAATLCSMLEGGGASSGPTYRKPEHALSSLPRGDAGRALALLRLRDLLSPDARAEADRVLRLWSDQTLARTPVVAQPAGTVAVIAALGHAGVQIETWRDAVLQWLSLHDTSTDPYRLLDLVEIALLLNDDPDAMGHGETAIGRLMHVKTVTGTWFPGTHAADRHNLSVIWGVPAVAHALARWASGGQVRSIRMVS